MTLSLDWLDEPGFPGGNLPRTVTLECEPAGGGHPAPEQACRSLLEVEGHFEKLPARNQPCPDVWEPVAATATGTWRGQEVGYREVFGNVCEAVAGTDQVFNF
ncbi:SSI family serine proteinase inhibitor [Streptomyces sp. YIM 98790]|uniref:SSI family serine proteinase inhibitor n=1 Tax=Streptomyces sp. YIM 98790 TaxID=2689077 RepID=UPI001A9E5340|nr:SSI family serine proteinase inhibitor [Streptomyces sp. YIM 98790]